MVKRDNSRLLPGIFWFYSKIIGRLMESEAKVGDCSCYENSVI